jgi:RNA polymerase-binding transcription factor DksA
MSARARRKTTKKKMAKKPAGRKPAKKKAVKKKTKKKVAKKKPVKKKTAKKQAKKVAKKKVVKKKSVKKKAAKKIPKPAPAKKRPLTTEEKNARARQRTADRKFLKESHAHLISRRAALIEAYHSAKGNTKASTTGGTEDYIDYAVSSYERDFSLSMTELERKQLLLVEEALGRIRRSEYGRCLNCGVAIPRRRLEVEAWARYCIPCQELDDQGLLEEPVLETDSQDEADESDAKGSKHDDEEEEEKA